MTKDELQTALIAAGWQQEESSFIRYINENRVFLLYDDLISFQSNNSYHEIKYSDCRFAFRVREVQLYGEPQHFETDIICDAIPGLKVRIEL